MDSACSKYNIFKKGSSSILEIDPETGRCKKFNECSQEMLYEIEWYRNIPQDLQQVTAKVVGYHKDMKNPYIELLNYDQQSLNNIFATENIEIEEWDKILKQLFTIHNKLQRYKLDLDSQTVKQILEDVYIHECTKQIDSLRNTVEFKWYFNTKIRINDQVYPGLNTILTFIPLLVPKLLINIECFSLVHGDYVLDNMLYCQKLNRLILIDPRSNIWGHGLYGDQRYDMARLSQSIIGKYDYIKQNRYQFFKTETYGVYKIEKSKTDQELENLFLSQLNKKYDFNEITFIESLLFLAEIPTYQGTNEQKHVMLMSGIEKFFSCVKRFGIC